MKGIILAGGTGSRLWPITRAISKQLVPVYNKPLIYYPLSTLMMAGITEVLVITTPQEQNLFIKLLGDGSQFGINIQYAIQPKPDGLAEAYKIGAKFIGEDDVALILGDNIFNGTEISEQLNTIDVSSGATIFGYHVMDPTRYGVAEVGDDARVVSLEEKPLKPKSSLAIPGLYFSDNSVIERVSAVPKSARGEYEIIGVLQSYLSDDLLELIQLPRGTAWLDCGTISSLNDASNYIRAIEERQGLLVGAPEEIAWRNKWISDHDLLKLADEMKGSEYAVKLRHLLLS